jgi:uncharacterized membrane protein YeiH
MDVLAIEVPTWVDVAAVGIGSLQGAMYAAQFRDRQLDLLGVAMIGTATGLGGGFLRDILLQRPLVALSADWYLGVAVVFALLGMLVARLVRKLDWVITVADALTIGLFGAIGVAAALAQGLPTVPAIFVGTISAVGGGVIRDILLNTSVTVMHVGSLYAVAAAAGTISFVVLRAFAISVDWSAVVCVVVTAAIRILAVRFAWSLPEQRVLRGIRQPRLVRPADLTGPIEKIRDL